MTDSALSLLTDLVASAQKAGADAADAVTVSSASRSISFREGQLEDVDGSESSDIGLRVFIGQRQAIASSSATDPASLSALVERTVEMARNVPEDPFACLAPEDRLFKGDIPNLDLADSEDLSTEAMGELARTAEDAARSVKGVTNSDGGGASSASYSLAIATSHGFTGSAAGTSRSVSVSAVAGEGTGMERDYDFSSARHWSDIKSAAELGQTAGEQAVARLGATRLQSGPQPIVFAPRVANSMIGHFTGAITGAAVARGSSFLKDALDTAVFSDSVSIIDDPLMTRGLRSRPFDGEGVTCEPSALIDDGVLMTWMLNAASARQLGLEVTGHAARSASSPPGTGGSNIYMAPSEISPADLISDIEDGFYVTELIGMGVNGVTGDYSRGAAGFRIEKGAITSPVSEVTIAGNLKDMFRALTPASDLVFKYGINAPTIRIDGMTLAGT